MKLYQLSLLAGGLIFIAGCTAMPAARTADNGFLQPQTVNIFDLPKELINYCSIGDYAWQEQNYQIISIDLNHDGQDEILLRGYPNSENGSHWFILQKSFDGKYAGIGMIYTPVYVYRSDAFDWDIIVEQNSLTSEKDSRETWSLLVNPDTGYQSIVQLKRKDADVSAEKMIAGLQCLQQKKYPNMNSVSVQLLNASKELNWILTDTMQNLKSKNVEERLDIMRRVIRDYNQPGGRMYSTSLWDEMYLERVAEYLAGIHDQDAPDGFEARLKVSRNEHPLDALRYMKILEKYAGYLWETEKFENAQAKYAEALHFFESQMNSNPECRVRAALVKSKLSRLCCDMQKMDESQKYAQDAIALMECEDKSQFTAMEYTALAAAYGALGYCRAHRGDNPMEAFQEALKLFRSIPDYEEQMSFVEIFILCDERFPEETADEYAAVLENTAWYLVANQDMKQADKLLDEACQFRYTLAGDNPFYLSKAVNLILHVLSAVNSHEDSKLETLAERNIDLLKNIALTSEELSLKFHKSCHYLASYQMFHQEYAELENTVATAFDNIIDNDEYLQLMVITYCTALLRQQRSNEAVKVCKTLLTKMYTGNSDTDRLFSAVALRLCGEGLSAQKLNLEALQYLEKSAETASKLTDNEVMSAQIQKSLETVRSQLTDYEKQALKSGKELFEEEQFYRFGKEPKKYWETLLKVAELYRANGGIEQAKSYASIALNEMFCQPMDATFERGNLCLKTGDLLFQLGDLENAEKVCREALTLGEQGDTGPRLPIMGRAYLALAKLSLRMEKQTQAEIYCIEAARMFNNYIESYGENFRTEMQGCYLEAAQALYERAGIMEAKGRGNETEELLVQALALQERDPGKAAAAAERAKVRTMLGWVRLAAKPEAAKVLFDEALALLRELKGEEAKANELLLADALAGRSLIEKETEESKAMAAEAKQILAAQPDNPDAVKIQQQWDGAMPQTK